MNCYNLVSLKLLNAASLQISFFSIHDQFRCDKIFQSKYRNNETSKDRYFHEAILGNNLLPDNKLSNYRKIILFRIIMVEQPYWISQGTKWNVPRV